MREFKFRVWDFNTKNFVTDENEDGWAEEWCITPDGRLLCDHGRSGYLPSQVEVSFWTGLQDKNGKDIFDGDIIENGAEKTIGKLFWHQEYGAWFVEYKDEVSDSIDMLGHISRISTYISNFCEIIGNIYENPELMEAKDG